MNADKQPIPSSARIKSLIHPEMKFIRSDFGFAIGQIFLFLASNKNLGNKLTANECNLFPKTLILINVFLFQVQKLT